MKAEKQHIRNDVNVENNKQKVQYFIYPDLRKRIKKITNKEEKMKELNPSPPRIGQPRDKSDKSRFGS